MKLLEKREFKNASWLICGRIIQMILSLFINLITARYFGPSNYGTINYASSFVAFFTSLCNLGLNYVIIKDLVVNKDNQGETIGTSIAMRAISSIISIFAIWGLVSIIDYDSPSTILIVCLCSFGVLFNVFDTFIYWFQVQYKSKVVSIATLLGYLILSLYRIVLLILKKDVAWFALASSIDYAVIGLLLWLGYKINKGPQLKISFQKAKKLLSQSYHYIISGMMVTIYGQTDKFMLMRLTSNEEVGYYSCASTICIAWVFVLAAIIDSLLPTIVKLHSKKDIVAYETKNKQLYAIVFYISVFVSVLILFVGRIAIEILYGQDYLPATMPLCILTWYIAFAYLGVARNGWLTCENKQKYEKYIYLIAAISNVCMNFLFIPIFGANGAAFATLITQLLTCMVIPAFFKDLRHNVKLMLEAISLKGVF